MFLNADKIFPFAFNPENEKTQKIVYQGDTMLTMNFDMSVENAPECAAVAIIFNEPKHFNELRFKVFTDLNLTAELKTVRLGQLEKFRAQKIISDGLVDFFDIEEEVKEIVFCCLKSDNESKKGKVAIKLVSM